MKSEHKKLNSEVDNENNNRKLNKTSQNLICSINLDFSQ